MTKASTTSQMMNDAEVRAGLAEIERGEMATEDETRAVYKRIGV